jgi:ribosomal-protein-alanine N-acetyltransferase
MGTEIVSISSPNPHEVHSMVGIPILETERLIIRELTLFDESWFIPLLQHPEVMHFSPKGPLLAGKARHILKQVLRSYELRCYGLMGCFVKGTSVPIGFCGVFLRELEGVLYPELGYRLFPEFWGKGYATEAARELMDDAFERLQLPQIFSFIDPLNIRSIRVAENIGERFAFHAFSGELLFSVYTKRKTN